MKRFAILLILLCTAFSVPTLGAIHTIRDLHNGYECVFFDGITVSLDRNLHNDRHYIPYGYPYPSPNGDYALNVHFRRFTDPNDPHNVIFIANKRTGEHLILERQAAGMIYALWSSDSRWVAYLWAGPQQQTIFTVADNRGQIRYQTYLPINNFAWSPTNDVLVLTIWDYISQSGNILFLSTDTFEPITHHLGELSYYNLIWSPDGNYLVYPTGSQIVVSDIKGTFTLPLTATQDSSEWRVEWSPNNRYLLVESRNYMGEAFLKIFPTRAADPILNHHLLTNVAYGTHLARWVSPTRINYFVQQYTGGSVYELWQFDVETAQHTKLLSDVLAYEWEGEKLLTMRITGNERIAEMWNYDLTNQIKLVSMPITSRLLYQFYHLGVVHVVYETTFDFMAQALNRYVFDNKGNLLFNDVTNDPNLRFWDSSARFLEKRLTIDGQFHFGFMDTTTFRTYFVPADILAQWQQLSPDLYSWSIVMQTTPDQKSWLVQLSIYPDNFFLYRIDPTDGVWAPIYESIRKPYQIEVVVWSPDSQRLAIVMRDYYNYITPYLIVVAADGSRRWDLGQFTGYSPSQLGWTKCGY